jgi:hypothetical protein
MLSLILTILILMLVYFVQQWHPFLAGVLAVTPVKIMATAIMTLEEGGHERLHEAIGGMLVGQLAWGTILLLAWLVLR